MDKIIGDKIPVKVGEFTFMTEVKDDGEQYFIGNRLIRKLLNVSKQNGYSLNEIVEDYITGFYTQEELLKFYVALSYSLSGLSELTLFSFLPIQNPAEA